MVLVRHAMLTVISLTTFNTAHTTVETKQRVKLYKKYPVSVNKRQENVENGLLRGGRGLCDKNLELSFIVKHGLCLTRPRFVTKHPEHSRPTPREKRGLGPVGE